MRRWLVILAGALLCLMAGALQAAASGTAYYINNQPGSNCNDGGAHTAAQPWCTFAPINKIKALAAGDQVLLARGGEWNEELNLAGHGTTRAPITLGAYGTGADPKILRNQGNSDLCVLLTDASYWTISNLEVGRASVGILLHYTQLFNNGVTISHINAHDNKGIWGGYSTDYPVNRHVLDPFASSLNINLSSGILFNLASYLTFSSSQYVLKGVTVNDVRGSGNMDSVAFDAETNTIENQDGHNAFQDVVLNGLFLSNDNGHQSKAYAAAGLGCSDALRLLGMTNVTVLNSLLYDEAGCYTPSGTAAVILGRVSRIRFINNIIFGVPASHSDDETAIDLELLEDHVELHGNLFAGNAGPGVEILNIHSGDHTNAIDFSGNTFAQNASSNRPGAASIWEDNKGQGYGTPTGTVRHNLYFEPHGLFFAGKNALSITLVNNRATTAVPDYAAEQFSGTQGKNQWRYLYESSDTNWTEMPHYSANLDNGAWVADGGRFISAFSMAPEECIGPCSGSGVARAWVASRRGTVSVRGHLLRADGSAPTGIRAVVSLVSGRNVTQIWPNPGKQIMGATGSLGIAANMDNVPVNAGDEIRFEVYASGNNTSDAVSWTPSVGYVKR